MTHRAINADFHNLFQLKFDKEMLEVGLFQLFFYLGRNLVVLSLAYHMYVNLSYELWQIAAYFLIGQIFWVLPVPLVGPIIKLIGVKHSIASRAIALFVFWLLLPLLLSENFGQTMLYLLPLFFIRGLFGATSNMAYDIFLSHHLNKQSRGQSLAYLQIAIMVGTILAPIMGGIITDQFGFVYTTYIGLGFFLLAAGVLMITPDEKFNFPYSPQKFILDLKKETPKSLLQAEFGRVFFDGVMFVAWPLFLIIVLTNMTSIGLVAGISSGVAMAVAFWIGKRMDSGKKGPETTLRQGAYRSIALNLIRGVWWEPITIGIIDSLNKVNDQTMKVPYDMQFYKWIHAGNTLERAHIRVFLAQGVYLFTFAIVTLLLYYITSVSVVFISVFVLASMSLWWTQKISEVGRTVLDVELEAESVIIEKNI
ncbi:MFS transporter [bacterium]|nr:MFS transporter [bacterium]NCQ55530.1 MFS transporter [Candidatus Parcubacteria bacterium]NCS67541.1 MFS transporter [Candidatus Peregrinibacteria bacterium]NCS96294.1 MFS transporter [bacterium]